jgi:hypothetical protein
MPLHALMTSQGIVLTDLSPSERRERLQTTQDSIGNVHSADSRLKGAWQMVCVSAL